jgi:hypothetical protein
MRLTARGDVSRLNQLIWDLGAIREKIGMTPVV